MIEYAKGHARNPLWIGRFREGVSETLINKGLQGRGSGDALNTRALGHRFLEMRLRFRPRVFPILLSSGRGSETRADKGIQGKCPETL